MEENRFQTPDSNLIDQNEVELQLASRWARLGASILDAIIMMIPLMLVLYLTGFFDQVLEGEEPSMMMNLVMGLVGVVVFAAINFKFLLEEADSINVYKPEDHKKNSKRYCGMNITDNPLYDL